MPPHILFGQTEAMWQVRRQVLEAMRSCNPVLIRGENGTGKRTVAEFVHSQAPWGRSAFLKAYCPDLAGTPLERELFDAWQGPAPPSYNSGTECDFAETGPLLTVFFDEVTELDSVLRNKILAGIRCGRTFSMAGNEHGPTSAYVIFSAQVPPGQGLDESRAWKDFFRRINVQSVSIAPLRERRGDIPILIEYFSKFYLRKFGRRVIQPSKLWIRDLQGRGWPGNIRELENTVCRYVLLESRAPGEAHAEGRQVVSFSDATRSRSGISRKQLEAMILQKQEDERKTLLRVLVASHGNRRQAARTLHISDRSLLN